MILKQLEVGWFMTNAYIIGCEETKEGAIIDPGGDANKILKIAEENSLSIKYIINTHAHPDHISENKTIKEKTGADILIHKDDAPLITSAIMKLASLLGMFFTPISPDKTLDEGDIIKIGNIQLSVLHTPGHSPGGICLLTESTINRAAAKIAFTGDTLFAGSVGRTDFPGCSYTDLIRSIKQKLLTLDDETKIYPGHGPNSTIGYEKSTNPFCR